MHFKVSLDKCLLRMTLYIANRDKIDFLCTLYIRYLNTTCISQYDYICACIIKCNIFCLEVKLEI